MKWNLAEIGIIILITTILLLSFTQRVGAVSDVDDYRRIAGVLIGEGGTLGDDYDMMACTVRNRLDRGWSLNGVLRDYNAQYYIPTQEHIDALKTVLLASRDKLSSECQSAHFMYATWYADKWINPNVQPVIVIGGHNYYRYEDYGRLWQKK